MDAIKVFGLNGLHENTAIKFTETGVVLSCGLNVSPNISLILQKTKDLKGKVVSGTSRKVYKQSMSISAIFINSTNIIKAQKELLRQVQIDINLAKAYYHNTIANNLKKLE